MDLKVPIGGHSTSVEASSGKKAWTAPRLTLHGTLPALTLGASLTDKDPV